MIAQQALLMVLERGELPLHELARALAGAFPELAAAGIAELLAHLQATGHLDAPAAGLVQIGPQAEAA